MAGPGVSRGGFVAFPREGVESSSRPSRRCHGSTQCYCDWCVVWCGAVYSVVYSIRSSWCGVIWCVYCVCRGCERKGSQVASQQNKVSLLLPTHSSTYSLFSDCHFSTHPPFQKNVSATTPSYRRQPISGLFFGHIYDPISRAIAEPWRWRRRWGSAVHIRASFNFCRPF